MRYCFRSSVQFPLPCNLLRRPYDRFCGHGSVWLPNDAKSPLRDHHRPPHLSQITIANQGDYPIEEKEEESGGADR